MSGIVGIFNTDGAPVDRELLSAMTMFMRFRGPDAQQIWRAGNVGFGHALLSIARDSGQDDQPATLDGKIWITADARIDARAELLDKLRSKGRVVSFHRPDAELILHAYHVWGRACVDHLLGDFAFAIWDGNSRKLFCARDHIGIKLLYYAKIGNTFIFSNTLECLRVHPLVSDQINDRAICDFLLFDYNLNWTTTFFTDISRLPSAHTLECDEGSLSVRRFWTLPEAKPVRYKRAEECLEQFHGVFDAATSDRLRGDNAGMFLSGGLDSPTVAVSARRVVDKRGTPFDLRGYTHVFDTLIPHEERHFAGLVGEALRIPIQYALGDGSRLYDQYNPPEFSTPEPMHLPVGFSDQDPFRYLVAEHRVGLTGFGGDPALGSFLSRHIRELVNRHQFGRLAADLARFLLADGRFSRLYLRNRWRKLFEREENPTDDGSGYPGWLNPDFEKKFGMRDLWNKGVETTQPNQSARPEAYEAVTDPMWGAKFEPFDSGTTKMTAEIYHPFFDLRVLRFLIALPTLPWCSDKELLRQAARRYLPDAVRLRPKSPLQMDPIVALLRRPDSVWVDHFKPVPELGAYVRRDLVPPVCGVQESLNAWIPLRPLSLNFWLQRRKAIDYKIDVEGCNGIEIKEIT